MSTTIFHPDGTVENVPDPRPLETRRAARMQDLADRRGRAEREFTFAGQSLRLDENTQSRINSAISYLERDPEADDVRWEVSRGIFATFNLAMLNALGVAAGRHVQACFRNAETLTTAIVAAGDPADVDLEQGWP